MAYGIHWKILFTSLRTMNGNSPMIYTLSIYDEGYTGTPVELMGGEEPFTTDEDNDEDIFKSIRTQTGYFRIVDNGKDANGNNFAWTDLIPETDLSHPVILTDGNGSVKWQGFMQAQDFGNTLYGNPQEREFPVQCPLAVLSAIDIDVSVRELKNFAYIIYSIVSSIPGISISSFVFQGGSDALGWMKKKVDWQNFVKVNADNEIKAAYDGAEVIENLCAFWGWSVRYHESSLIFSCADDDTETTSVTLTATQMNTLAQGTDVSVTPETFLQDVALSGDIFANTNNSEYMVRGHSNISVNANGNVADKEVISVFPDEVAEEMSEETPVTSETYDDITEYFTPNRLQISSNFLTGTARDTYASFNMGSISKERGKYDTMSLIRIRKTFDLLSQTPHAQLQTTFEHCFYDENNHSFNAASGIRLSGTIYVRGQKYEYSGSTIDNPTMLMSIGIGKTEGTALWWNGRNAWSSEMTKFEVALGNTDDDTLPTIYKYSDGIRQYAEVYRWIRTDNAALSGLIFIKFWGSYNMTAYDGERKFDIADFKVEFNRKVFNTNTAWVFGYGNERKDSREYTARNEGNTRNEWDVDVPFASDNNMSFGYGVLIGEDGKQMKTATFNGVEQVPEQRLADRVAAYFASTKRKVEMDLRTDTIADLTPRKRIQMDGVNYWPVSISHRWHDDITKVVIMQL